MGDRADAVVVGGGIMGCSVALALAQAGVRDVRVVERDSLFEGTSAAGAGFLGLWAVFNPTQGEEELAVQRYGIEYYRSLQDSGQDVDFAQNGVLFVAPDEAAWKQIEPFASDDPDVETVAIDPAEIAELTGGAILAEGVFGGVLQRGGGQVFAPKVGAVMSDRLQAAGAVVDTRRPVVDIKSRGGRVTGVGTARGTVECDTVVLAAGAWSNELLRPLDTYLPTVPQITSRIISEPLDVPAQMPALFLMGLAPEPGGTFLWARGHEGALLWGGTYSRHPRNAFVGAPVPERFDEVPIDGVVECQRLAATAASFMPVLGSPKSLSLKHGAPCYTPDRRGLVGPMPGVEGLYVMAGDNEAGITNGPGFAKALADQITAGSSDLASLEGWRVDRFGDRFSDDSEVLEALARSPAG